LGAILKRFPLATTQMLAWRHSIGISKAQGTRIKSLAVTLQVVLSRRVFETIKIRRRLQKFLSAYEYIQMIGGISSPGASYPNGSKGHPRNREARFLCPQATHRHPTCIRRALYDHVDLVIAIVAIYLDPRVK